jgi:hypothetical protein
MFLTKAQSLDLSRIKTVALQILPSSLGKNAIVEAELEVKTLTETEVIDYEAYERMRQLGVDGNFPLQSCIQQLRERCLYYSTLAEREPSFGQHCHFTNFSHLCHYHYRAFGRVFANHCGGGS